MDKKQKEKIAINAANTWCRYFKCDGIIRDTNDKCDKDKLLTCHQWYHGYRTALLALDDDRVFDGLWKPADGDDLPEIDREVIALLNNGKVVFAHRPNPEGWDAKSIITEKVEHYIPETYGKGGWNQPDIRWWLDTELPKEIEL